MLPVEIDDNALFTGREVKRILRAQARDESPYLKIGAAAGISGTNRSTLKSAAPRYFAQQQRGEEPLIRVRRTSGKRGAHWLFHEGDCWRAGRLNEQGTSPTSPGDDLPAQYAERLSSRL